MAVAVERGERTRAAHERHPSSEQMPRYQELIGLQACVLLGGDALNPEKRDLPVVTQNALGSHATRDYRLYNRASIQERSTYWSETGVEFEQQKRVWIDRTVNAFTSAQPFFQSEEGRAWSVAFERIGIQSQDFAEAHAEKLYHTYFSGERKESYIKQFVSHVLDAYRNEQNQLEYEKLRNDLPAFQWFSTIFGKNSSEIVAQLIDAEAKLERAPQKLVAQANEGGRINNLLPKEVELLRFLQPHAPEARIREQPHIASELPAGYKWRYDEKRRDHPRVYPGEHEVETILHPHYIAHELKRVYPERYGGIPLPLLAKQIREEQLDLTQALNHVGLHTDRYLARVKQTLTRYENFLRERYGITIPEIQKLTFFPIAGKTAEYYNAGRLAFGLVYTHWPVIFLDMGKIAQRAKEIGRAEWREMTPDELGRLMERLLNEIEPHEYTHLLSDLAFWHLMKSTKTGEEEVLPIPGKAGLDVTKPVKTEITEDGEITNLEIVSRGKRLTEALTTELTFQWAKDRGERLAIHAYENERQVLSDLADLLAKEQGISKDEALAKFVRASFGPSHFRTLAKELSGRHVEKGKVAYRRPHFLSTIYALMEYDAFKTQTNEPTPYDLTRAYISGKVNREQAQDLVNFLQLVSQEPPPYGLYLSPRAIRHLAGQLGLQVARRNAQAA